MKVSAGTLLYRRTDDGLCVLLVHPSGAYNRKAPWSIPKGLPEPGEELVDAARRETREETGVEAGELSLLGTIDYQKSRKRVCCFFGLLDDRAAPRPASWEVDRAEVVPLSRAREILHKDQVAFLDLLVEKLEREP